ncbi:MAG: twin-arginine translocase TatA/TatE family subunit [Elusimicrobiota bacterium]
MERSSLGGIMGGLGTSEIIVIAVVGLILFGPSKIPEFARSLGRAVNMFKKGLNEGLEEDLTKKDEKKDDNVKKG